MKGYALCAKWAAGAKANKGRLECSATAYKNLNRGWNYKRFIGKNSEEIGLWYMNFPS